MSRTGKQLQLGQLVRVHLFTAFGAMKIGMNILKQEHVAIDKIVGHGGIFKTPEVGQKVLAAVMDAPVTVMETAGEAVHGTSHCWRTPTPIARKPVWELTDAFLDKKGDIRRSSSCKPTGANQACSSTTRSWSHLR